MSLPVLFGANVDPVWEDPGQPLRITRQVEKAGLDLVTVQDHPYQPRFYDAWTLISYLAGATQKVTFVPTVANLPLRPPAMLAKSAASLDVLAPGRIQLGLGTGAFWDAIEAMGGPRREPKEAVAALDEAIDITRLMWSGERSVRFKGEHYSISGVHPGPAPSSGLGIWLGAYGPRMLTLTGRKADGWMPSYGFLGLDRLKDAVARLDAGAKEAGRDPAALRKIYNLNGLISPVESAVPFQGNVRQWVDQLVSLVREYGMNGFVYWPDADHLRQLTVFALEVVPGVRAALA
ncbi:LLM class flavin-dependent oxidoreductase [Streptomyces sp. NPDC058683]|uniref:LLM class flavin-dependent oxidoreductase n=1 Tax=Streptomyces sp. NPDC058683 TaxID=3346597 RepID=UPI0036524504